MGFGRIFAFVNRSLILPYLQVFRIIIVALDTWRQIARSAGIERLDLLRAKFYPLSPDHWSEQQIHLLRCRWNECNRRSERNMNHSKLSMEQEDPANVLFVINRWYQQAKQMSMSRAELQWKLNQLLEQENIQYYELY